VGPFVVIMIITLAVVMIFPQIALWLPQWHYGVGS
jgi:TRAP-type C4-dicarboxylate transport system permease large subunit